MVLVEAKGVKKVYGSGDADCAALRGIDLCLQRGDFVAVAGASGSGKTTLLNLIGGVDIPSEGTIWLDGVLLTGLSAAGLTDMRRRKIGFIFQSFNLMQALTVYENIEFPLLFMAVSSKERKSRVSAMIEQLGLTETARRKVTAISGGQQQRCAIGRALIKEPILVLADEPTGNLDSETGQKIVALMRSFNQANGTTFLFSTHDPMIMRHADGVYHLRDGRMVDEGAKPNP